MLGALLLLVVVTAWLGSPDPSFAARDPCPPTGCYCTVLTGWYCNPLNSTHACRLADESPSQCVCRKVGNQQMWVCP